ncbi:hypothetical protein [Calidifontibacillus oryziterrae]|uniref:hypothetical protein n=1 Tax=Calidifontibacillus oryziterrae TaxID=1191699 RepID=UPI001E31AC75|nr:hypothetical protein [Calidifontibacillus oryziterrae]
MKLLSIFFISVCYMCISAINTCFATTQMDESSPKIIDIKTSPTPIINQWVILRQRTNGELHIEAIVENAWKVRFWTVPVKNKSWQDSWEHKKLISEDQDGEDGWTTTFYYGKENLLTFIVVEAVGMDGQTARWPFYVAYKK